MNWSDRTMKAMRFYAVNEPLKLEEIPIPKIGPYDVLVDVKACGICGSDIHMVYEGIDGVIPKDLLPVTLGHESSGVIVEVGRNVLNWNIGDRVAVNSLVTCGKCPNCLKGRTSICLTKRHLGFHLDGALAEYMSVPARNLTKIPDGVLFDQAAVITDAVATPYHAITARGKLQLGETVAILGCGGLGIHGVQLCLVGGASQIIAIDMDDEILERARKVGATHTINVNEGNAVKKIKAITGGTGVDLALEFVGHKDTISLGVKSLKSGGRLVVCGVGTENITILPANIFVWNEFQLIGSYSWEHNDISTLFDLVESGRIDLSGSISAKFPLDETNTALDNLKNRHGKPIRIIISQE